MVREVPAVPAEGRGGGRVSAEEAYVAAKLAEEGAYRALVERREQARAASAALALAQTDYETAQRAATAAREALAGATLESADRAVDERREKPLRDLAVR